MWLEARFRLAYGAGTMNRARLRQSYSWYLLLIAAALVMRALVPAGMMTAASADGGITVEICNSDVQWHLPTKAKHPGKSSAENGSGHCLFAGHAGGDTPPEPAGDVAAPFASTARFAGFVTPAAARSHARQLPPARAPPVLA